ncbi:MAG: DUF2167 domain-containing protein [Pseudomonadota bacterium]
MFKKLQAVLLLCASIGLISSAAADQAPSEKISAEDFVASLNFQHGKITLANGIATLNLPDSFRYLGPADAERVLVEAWGNPPGAKNLGMIFPSDTSPLSNDGWGVIVTYDEDGHVKDDDADSINYVELLKEMKESTLAANEERKKRGYSAMTLVGWAEPPHYDKSSHKFYWAKEFATENEAEHSLNYNIRVLGRKGVLVLNAVAGMAQIAQIKREMPVVVGFTDFSKGNSFAEFDEKTDKVAEYGLAALVAGGVAAKLGFFGKIFALLLAFKKILLLGFIALGTAMYKFFGMKKD